MNQQHTRMVFDGVGDRERAAVDLLTFHQEAVDRPRLYRIMYAPRRQPEDVEMSRVYSEWICRYYMGEI